MLSTSAFAQSDTTRKAWGEIPPTFPGGIEKFYQFVNKTLKYPNDAWSNRTRGNVFVNFIIDTTGTIVPESIKVKRGLSESCDKEAIRIIKKSPKWIPGMQNGRPVAVLYELAINFRPED